MKLKDRLAALEEREKEKPSTTEADSLVKKFSYVSKVLTCFIGLGGTDESPNVAEQRMIAAGISESEAKRLAALGYIGARNELMPVTSTGSLAREMARVREKKAIEAVIEARKPRIHTMQEPGTWLQRIPGKR